MTGPVGGTPLPVDPVQASLLASFRDVLVHVAEAERFGRAPDLATGAALRAVCSDARRLRIPITRVLLTLKAAWHSLPAQGRAGWLDADAALTRVVSSCIQDYYTPGAEAEATDSTRKPMMVDRRGDGPRLG